MNFIQLCPGRPISRVRDTSSTVTLVMWEVSIPAVQVVVGSVLSIVGLGLLQQRWNFWWEHYLFFSKSLDSQTQVSILVWCFRLGFRAVAFNRKGQLPQAVSINFLSREHLHALQSEKCDEWIDHHICFQILFEVRGAWNKIQLYKGELLKEVEEPLEVRV